MIEIILFVGIGIAIGGFMVCIWMFIRNERVYRLSNKINDEIRDQPYKEAIRMYGNFDCVTYNQMVYSLKPLKKWEIEWKRKLGLGA